MVGNTGPHSAGEGGHTPRRSLSRSCEMRSAGPPRNAPVGVLAVRRSAPRLIARVPRGPPVPAPAGVEGGEPAGGEAGAAAGGGGGGRGQDNHGHGGGGDSGNSRGGGGGSGHGSDGGGGSHGGIRYESPPGTVGSRVVGRARGDGRLPRHHRLSHAASAACGSESVSGWHAASCGCARFGVSSRGSVPPAAPG